MSIKSLTLKEYELALKGESIGVSLLGYIAAQKKFFFIPRSFVVKLILFDIQNISKLLQPDAVPKMTEFALKWNMRSVLNSNFWQRDGSAVFNEIVDDAKNILTTKNIQYSDEDLKNYFLLAFTNLAHYVAADRKMIKLVKALCK